jgi:hypothetical protein
MTAQLYPLAKQAFLTAGMNLSSDNIKLALLDNTYTYSGAHQHVSDLTGIIVRSGNLASKSVTNGVFNAANETITAVVTGHTIVAVVGYDDTGTDSTSQLIWYDDGISTNTNGGDITVNFDTGAAKIFAL